MNKTQFEAGDSINAEVFLDNFTRETNVVTVQLWIENMATHQRWRYRYPLINGYTRIALKIAGNIHGGLYAFNFILQKDFFNIKGTIDNAGKKDTTLNCVVVARDKQTIVKKAMIYQDKTFSVRRLLFQDTAFIVFSSQKRAGNNDLFIRLQTSLDSAFTPAAVVTKMLTIGKAEDTTEVAAAQQSYHFNVTEKDFKGMLKEVVVTAKEKKAVEKFDEANTSGMFRGADAITLDGIGSDDIAHAYNIYNYIMSKVPGIQVKRDDETGNNYFSWRNAYTTIYINEFRLDKDAEININPGDIAMIKIFRPGYSLSGGAGGAIAIYTKVGAYETPGNNRRYSFYMMGYNALAGDWQ